MRTKATSPIATPTQQRGFAMLLVMICLVVATVLTSAAIMATDNAPAIGANAADRASADWAAEAAAEFVVAVLQTDADWLSLENGEMLDGFTMAGADVNVTLSDLDGNEPDEEDTEILLTAVAKVNEITKTVTRQITVVPPVDVEGVIDAELGEFAVFATSSINVGSGCAIKPWAKSPKDAGTSGVKVGAGEFMTLGNAVFSILGTYTRTSFYAGQSSSALLKTAVLAGSLLGNDGVVLDLDVPAICAAKPSAFGALTLAAPQDRTFNGAAASATVPVLRFRNLNVRNLAVATLDGGAGTHYQCANLTVQTRGVLRIVGQVELCVTGMLTLSDRATIELADSSSSLIIYTGGDIAIDDTAVGCARAIGQDSGRIVPDVTAYSDPSRVRFRGLGLSAGGNASPTINITDDCIIIATIHAPTATIVVSDDSDVIGRITGKSVHLQSDSDVHYDPLLDSDVGFTAIAGPLYTAEGDPIEGLVDAIDSFDVSLGFQSLAAHINDAVQFVDAGDDEDGVSPRSGYKAQAKLSTSASAEAVEAKY